MLKTIKFYERSIEESPVLIIKVDITKVSQFWQEIAEAGSYILDGQFVDLQGNEIYYTTAQVGFRCDGCAQDDCEEYNEGCSWCSFASNVKNEVLYLPLCAEEVGNGE